MPSPITDIRLDGPDPRPKQMLEKLMASQGVTADDLCPDLSPLDTMSHGELVSLCRRVCAARWGEVALMTLDERMEAAKLKLWHGGLSEKEIMKALPALREVMDREHGKPSQSIAMTVEDKGLGKLSDERLMRLERELARMTGEDALVIAPVPHALGASDSDECER